MFSTLESRKVANTFIPLRNNSMYYEDEKQLTMDNIDIHPSIITLYQYEVNLCLSPFSQYYTNYTHEKQKQNNRENKPWTENDFYRLDHA